jgi:hypothetical protein
MKEAETSCWVVFGNIFPSHPKGTVVSIDHSPEPALDLLRKTEVFHDLSLEVIGGCVFRHAEHCMFGWRPVLVIKRYQVETFIA